MNSSWVFFSPEVTVDSIGFLLSGFMVAVAAILLAQNLIAKSKNKTEPTTTSANPVKKLKRKAAICPFSAETNFIVEIAEHLPPAPLDTFEDWIDANSSDFGNKPLAARWLNAGLSGQDVPGIVRAGLKRLRSSKHFLVEEPFRMKEELMMKKKALEDPHRRELVFVAEEDSMDAQRECLELFLSYLPRRYPDLYKFDEKANTLHVVPIDTTFFIDEWMNKKNGPLELCELIVQEDLVLMRPPNPRDDFDQFAMAAGAVIFSFTEVPQKLGKPVSFIHAPVPGYEKHLRRSMDLTFNKILKIEQPMWRNNWGIAPSGELDKPISGSTEAHSYRKFSLPTREEIKGKYLKVEYQTIRRLPRSKNLLFTVKVMKDRMDCLEKVPKAAHCLASSIRGMSQQMRKYKGIEDDATCEEVLAYLDSI